MAAPLSKVLQLLTPSLSEIAAVLQSALKENFAEAQVSVVDCPDLTKSPFHLADPGLCGAQKVVDVGGPPYLTPLARRDKLYSIKQVAGIAGVSQGLAVGAGAGPWPEIGTNSEMMANVRLGDDPQVKTYVAKVNPEDGSASTYPIKSDAFALMANLYLSNGKPGKVLEIKASKRTGEENFMSCMRNALASHYGDNSVAIGGTFVIEKGKANLHVMPDFSVCPLTTQPEVDNWLKYFECEAPLVALGYLVSHDPGLDLRPEHFHCFSDHNEGGHYHYDTTPDTVAYRGYFNVADTLYRIDQPPNQTI